jgi:hypothetical protein
MTGFLCSPDGKDDHDRTLLAVNLTTKELPRAHPRSMPSNTYKLAVYLTDGCALSDFSKLIAEPLGKCDCRFVVQIRVMPFTYTQGKTATGHHIYITMWYVTLPFNTTQLAQTRHPSSTTPTNTSLSPNITDPYHRERGIVLKLGLMDVLSIKINGAPFISMKPHLIQTGTMGSIQCNCFTPIYMSNDTCQTSKECRALIQLSPHSQPNFTTDQIDSNTEVLGFTSEKERLYKGIIVSLTALHEVDAMSHSPRHLVIVARTAEARNMAYEVAKRVLNAANMLRHCSFKMAPEFTCDNCGTHKQHDTVNCPLFSAKDTKRMLLSKGGGNSFCKKAMTLTGCNGKRKDTGEACGFCHHGCSPFGKNGVKVFESLMAPLQQQQQQQQQQKAQAQAQQLQKAQAQTQL